MSGKGKVWSLPYRDKVGVVYCESCGHAHWENWVCLKSLALKALKSDKKNRKDK